MTGDALGALGVDSEGVLRRDEMVFQFALTAKAPICMLLSGGYTPASASTITASITNLVQKFNLNSRSAA